MHMHVLDLISCAPIDKNHGFDEISKMTSNSALGAIANAETLSESLQCPYRVPHEGVDE
jgi:hypothetical protein